MKVWINGEPVETNGATNVAALAERLGFQPNTVLIELNATALRQREWAERTIAEGDRIEVLRVVSGG